ncbi:MAG TPA: beta-ketoacyl-ACP synthase III [Clostridia bacterium]|nr:beta-ketoacyl-ACP synthase III [Clostridia bacterium]HRX42701.1 beta-ketoacyl-ACP synthase III [Clostridia bacterium]
MNIIQTAITGTGFYVPNRILTNHELEHMVETTDEWIVERSGIHERRILDKEKRNTDMAVAAGKMALTSAGVNAEELDLIIVATITPDYFTPSVACMVQNEMGASKAAAFDVNAACSGFVYAMATANAYIKSGMYKNALVIGSEALSKVIDWNHRSTCVLFGDGAGAVVIEASEASGIVAFDLGASGDLGNAITIPGTYFSEDDIRDRNNELSHVIRMDGREVFKFATRTMASSVEKLLEENGVAKEEVDIIVPHQANIRILQTASKKLGIDMDRIYSIIHKYGNTSSASIPIALHSAVSEGRINSGDTVVMTGFGGGLTWASALVRWI